MQAIIYIGVPYRDLVIDQSDVESKDDIHAILYHKASRKSFEAVAKDETIETPEGETVPVYRLHFDTTEMIPGVYTLEIYLGEGENKRMGSYTADFAKAIIVSESKQ